MKKQKPLNLYAFSKKYGISIQTVIKFMKKNYIRQNIHYTNQFQLHQNKRLITKPNEVYKIILEKSNIVRKKKGVQKNRIYMSIL